MNYAQTAQNADKLLGKFGQQLTVTRYTTSRNATTGVVTTAPIQVGTARAVEVPVTQGLIQSFSVRLDEASLTAKTMRAFKISALLGFQPAPQDKITLADGSVWPVIGCTPANPAGTPLAYTVGVAK